MQEEGLSAHLLRCLEHLKQARALGTSIRAYARAHGLKPRMLYDAQKRLKNEAAIVGDLPAGGDRPAAKRGETESSEHGFVSVQVERPIAGPSRSLPVLRIQHVRGHVVEFGSWPPAELLAIALSGGRDAAA